MLLNKNNVAAIVSFVTLPSPSKILDLKTCTKNGDDDYEGLLLN